MELKTLSRLGRAALKRNRYNAKQNRPPQLPSDHIETRIALVNNQAYADFVELVAWPDATTVHPCWLHIQAFGLHMDLMLQRRFPLPLMGLVHLENRITQYQPVAVDALLKLKCWLANPVLHRRGWTFDIVTTYEMDGELVWRGISRQLFRCQHEAEIQGEPNVANLGALVSCEQWTLADNLGRQYARVSADYNPIHLYPFSAKLLGFERQIAHGMWSKARCMSSMHDELNAPYHFAVQFKKPVFLPAKVTLQQFADEKSERRFNLVSETGEVTHLSGLVTSAPQASDG